MLMAPAPISETFNEPSCRVFIVSNVATEPRRCLPDPRCLLPEMTIPRGNREWRLRRDLDSLSQRHGPDGDYVKANWAIYVRQYGDTRAGSRHREPCPNRWRPQHQHSAAHAAPPVGTNRAPALHLQPWSRRGGAGRQAGPA